MEKSTYNEDDEITLKDALGKIRQLIVFLLSKWIVICLFGVVGVALALTIDVLKKKIYTAECTFVLEEDDASGGLGVYSGIASQFGVSLGSGGGGLFQGDNIIELYKSRLMLYNTLFSKVTVNDKQAFLIDKYVQFNKLPETMKKVAQPDFNFNPPLLTRKQDSIVSEIIKTIRAKNLSISRPDKKLSIISVKYSSGDEWFSKTFTERLVVNVNKFYTDTKTKKSSQSIATLQRQADSVRVLLNAAIGRTGASLEANPNANPALQRLRVPAQQRQIDVEANSAIYIEIMKNLEITKMSYRKEMPLIQIIDQPVYPLESNRSSKLMLILVGGMAGALATIAFLSLKRLLS
ncbi:lipopolysaccharide biosynthesis protein [Hufsiella ginkgonis]|uniref:Lipopolysaccharide biosynthesis protein n=1 Tax=Hufsiella ginkgonis TaxID=2695274 RepID=A0A7K1Y2T3_9SPHI|nr:lipopolysaccharide biosynthesis protein [Hufsiella ginkgonis]MXV17398.1 lipopolysaccharide biosynthesis protein [Hufsiella ginkgonis]